jgi:hypothetical protein
MVKTQVNGIAEKLLERWIQNAGKLDQIAAEIPAGKFDWRPLNDVRSCGDVLRHAAFWNRYLAASIRGEKADESQNELRRAEFPSKDAVLTALRRSSREVSEALEKHGASLAPDAAATVLGFLEHNAEHYGQLAVYCRLLEIVPPASRS